MRKIADRNTTIDTVAFLLDEMALHSDDETSSVVKMIFDMAERGESVADILDSIDLEHNKPRFEGYINLIKKMLGEG